MTAPVDVTPPPSSILPEVPSRLYLSKVNLVVITPDSPPVSSVHIALNEEDYKKLSINFTKILRWIKEARSRIELSHKSKSK